ncbi:hypothetical protein O4159_12915 [Gordonia terrae]|uniref:hypothetical protein n=1 Tax=Gordonia hongkongensis TaxID=1701090 RepID=UPI0022B4580F|nr:hypothetical protein [Gordonia terrae]
MSHDIPPELRSATASATAARLLLAYGDADEAWEVLQEVVDDPRRCADVLVVMTSWAAPHITTAEAMDRAAKALDTITPPPSI